MSETTKNRLYLMITITNRVVGSGRFVDFYRAFGAPVVFTARLYPANDLAVRHGMVGGVVTNDLNGRGTFNANIQGESFVGEATRKAGSSREGLASGAGNRGSYLSCQYTMNSATLGTGICRLSDGAQFTMHVGQ